MPSEKATRILLAKSELDRTQIKSLTEREAWGLIYTISPPKPKDTRLQVCFTGLGVVKKKEFVALAERAGMRKMSKVTKHLDILCVGDNAGPKKIEKAERQGVQILTEEQFRALAGTGEVPPH